MLERFAQDIKARFRESATTNSFNEPVYTYSELVLSGVLMHPEYGLDEPLSETRNDGHKIVYSIVIPKAYSELDFENAQFLVDDEWYTAIGAPKKYDACPTDYSCIVQVEKRHG